MSGALRYARLLVAFGKFNLASEMSFRGNFIFKVIVEVGWLCLMLFFYGFLFGGKIGTNNIQGWDHAQFLVFMGIYFSLEGIVETFFLSNCGEFAELIRSGNLDLYLLKPIDEQFLVTCRTIDWSTVPNIIMGLGVLTYGLVQSGWEFDPLRAGLFIVLFGCGVGMAYSFLVMLMSTAVWLIRNQSLMELWWLFTMLMRYPRGIFSPWWAVPIGWFFTFIIPILLVTNVPAETLVKLLDWKMIALTVVATVALLSASRWFFRWAMQSYRSASS